MARLTHTVTFLPAFPTPENTPKRYFVANVQKNYVSLLFEQGQSGHVFSTLLPIRNAAFIPLLETQGLSAVEVGKRTNRDERFHRERDRVFLILENLLSATTFLLRVSVPEMEGKGNVDGL
jgi:hypothetical protein